MRRNDLQAISFEALIQKGGAMRNTFSVRKPVVQVALIILLLAVVAVAFTRAQNYAGATLDAVAYNTVRATSNGTN